jgi:hypothetical protein
MRHGIDGNLHVGGGNFPEPDWQGILRTFDGETGGRIGEFQVGTNRYISSVELGLDGAVYVMHVPLSWRPGFESSSMRVSRFDLQASFASGLGVEAGGFYVDPVGPAEDFSYPDATFGPDGALYVSNFRSNSITRHSPATGELINEFSDVYASDLTFLDGRLFGLTETNGDGNRVVEFDPQTGEVLRTLVDASQISAGCDNGCRFDAMVVFPVIVPEPPNAVIFFVVLASLGLLGPSVCRPAWRRR